MNIRIILPTLAILLSLSSCIPMLAGGSGGESIAYVAGELQTKEEASIDEGWVAVQAALEKLELNITTREKDSLSARAIAYGAEDKKVTVRLEREADRVVVLKIRVGLFGDQTFSMHILETIEAELGIGPG